MLYFLDELLNKKILLPTIGLLILTLVSKVCIVTCEDYA